ASAVEPRARSGTIGAGRDAKATTILARRDVLAAPLAPFGDGRRALRRSCSRDPWNDPGGARPGTRGIRPLRDRHGGGLAVPDAPRSHGRGVADEVRLPLRRREGLGTPARALRGRAPPEAPRRRARGRGARSARAVRR